MQLSQTSIPILKGAPVMDSCSWQREALMMKSDIRTRKHKGHIST